MTSFKRVRVHGPANGRPIVDGWACNAMRYVYTLTLLPPSIPQLFLATPCPHGINQDGVFDHSEGVKLDAFWRQTESVKLHVFDDRLSVSLPFVGVTYCGAC